MSMNNKILLNRCLPILLVLILFTMVIVGLPQKTSAAITCPAGDTPDKRFVSLGEVCSHPLKSGQCEAGYSDKALITFTGVENYCIRIDPNNPATLTNSCSVSLYNLGPIFSPTCWGRTASFLVGTALISITAWLLAAVGLLFNVLVDNTIITFGYLFNNAEVGKAIGTAWGAFRDIANIVIIGMFVFIAINMILGVKEFGEKKKVAGVLIIAALLNFSLLFTKVIIDASNFTAVQFYKMSQLSGGAESAADFGFNDKFSKKGITGQFIDLLGLGSLSEVSNALSSASYGNAKNQYATANGWMALLHGLVSATLLLVAALVLLYGCILLVTRAVLLIILMATSALAFASWLIPHHFIEQGWDTWWRALLKAAFFAPILMAMLWATLLVAQAIKPKEGALGHLIANPTGALDLNVLFSYLIVIGLLYASFRAAGDLSEGISGFNATKLALGAAAFAPVALASRFAVAPLWRKTGGRIAAGLEERETREIKKARLSLNAQSGLRDYMKIAKLTRQKERRGAVAGMDMDITNTAGAQALAQAVGMGGILRKTPVGGYAAGVKEKSDRFAKEAEVFQIKKKEKKRIREQAELEKQADLDKEQARRTTERDAAKTKVDTMKGDANTVVKPLQEQQKALMGELTDAQAKQDAKKQDHDAIIKELQKEVARAKTPDEQTEATGRLSKAREAQEEFLKTGAETLKIKEVQDRIKAPLADIEKKIADANAPVKVEEDKLSALDAELQKFESGMARAVREHGADVIEKVEEDTQKTAAEYAHRRWQTLWGTIGSADDDLVASATRKKFEKKGGAASRLSEALRLDGDIGGGGGGGGEDKGEKH